MLTHYQASRTRRDLNWVIDELATLRAIIEDHEDRITKLEAVTRGGVIGYTIDGGGAAITAGLKGYVPVPDKCTIQAWRIVGDQEGSIVVDVWKDTFANFPPTVDDSITGGEDIALSSADKAEGITLGAWTTSMNKGDWLAFNVDSASTVTRVTIALFVLYDEIEDL